MLVFVEEYGLDGFRPCCGPDGELWAVFGVSAQPSYVFINDDGTVSRHIGGMEPEAFTRQLQLLIDS